MYWLLYFTVIKITTFDIYIINVSFKNTAYIIIIEALTFSFLANNQNSRHNDLKLRQPSKSSSAYNRDPALVSKTVGEVEKWHVELVGIRIFFLLLEKDSVLLLLQFCNRFMEGVG